MWLPLCNTSTSSQTKFLMNIKRDVTSTVEEEVWEIWQHSNERFTLMKLTWHSWIVHLTFRNYSHRVFFWVMYYLMAKEVSFFSQVWRRPIFLLIPSSFPAIDNFTGWNKGDLAPQVLSIAVMLPLLSSKKEQRETFSRCLWLTKQLKNVGTAIQLHH